MNHSQLVSRLKSVFRKTPSDAIAVIGMGNRDRADDGAGILIADTLKKMWPKTVFSESDRPVESHVLKLLENSRIQTVLLIDTADFQGRPGEARLFEAHDACRIVASVSTHQAPVSLLIETLSQHDRRIFLLGLQPASTALMQAVSPEMREAVQTMISLLGRLLSEQD